MRGVSIELDLNLRGSVHDVIVRQNVALFVNDNP